MSLEFSPAVAAGAVGPHPVAPAASSPRRLDRYEIALLAVFGALSTWVVAVDLWRAVADGLVWTGTDGWYIVDQMQYLSWIQSVAHHGLVANLFVLRPTAADYFQPAILISGGLTALGVPAAISLLLWKPVAVAGMFLAVRAVAYRMLTGRFQRRIALVLGVLFASFSAVFGQLGIVGDMMSVWLSWGYPFALMAVALIVFAVVRYDRSRASGRVDWVPGLLSFLASTLHPWQGETLILLIVFAELRRWRDLQLWWSSRRWHRLALPAITLACTGVPLLYYLLLGHLDLSWNLARVASKHAFPWSAIAIGIAPLAAFAALGYRGASESFLELVMRLWAPVAILIYVFSATGLSATPLHAFDGITVPLAVLAVKGVSRTRLGRIRHGRAIAAVAAAAGIIPANAYALQQAPAIVKPASGNANFITKDEHAALRYLAHNRTPGGVLTQFYMGEVVPGSTGRRTLVGDCLWSEPACMPRSESADALFEGRMSRGRATQFILASRARFLLASCNAPNVDLKRRLGALISSVTRFGCATVYEVAAPPAGTVPPTPPADDDGATAAAAPAAATP